MKKEHQEIVENLKDLSRASIVSEAVKVIEELSAELASAYASVETYREQQKSEEKAAYDLRRIMHEVADYFGISTSLWPAAIAKQLKQLKDDKDEIETKWEELCKALGAHGPESDPLTGCDTNDEIHKRAMERLRDMIASEAQAREGLEFASKKLDKLIPEQFALIEQRDHWRAEAERLRECKESAPEAKQTTTEVEGWIRTCGQMIEDRDAWRTMALALVEKINPPTP